MEKLKKHTTQTEATPTEIAITPTETIITATTTGGSSNELVDDSTG
jgi:hypothetical protein